jgi:protoheme IX farnesyltransferase
MRAGYMVLPGGTGRNFFMALQIILPSIGLLILSFVPPLLGKGSMFCTAGTLLSGICFLNYGVQLVLQKTNVGARRLLFASILYLPVVFGLMVLDRM